MYIPLKPLFSRHNGIGVQFTDEPTGNLDSENTMIITELFSKLNKEYKTTYIIVTHEENLMENCTQTIRIKDGEITVE